MCLAARCVCHAQVTTRVPTPLTVQEELTRLHAEHFGDGGGALYLPTEPRPHVLLELCATSGGAPPLSCSARAPLRGGWSLPAALRARGAL